MVWPIIWGESYVGKTSKSMNTVDLASACAALTALATRVDGRCPQTRNRRPDRFFRTAASIFQLATNYV
jgi:hypothetical protein